MISGVDTTLRDILFLQMLISIFKIEEGWA